MKNIELEIRGHSDDVLMYQLDGVATELYPPAAEGPFLVGTLLVHSGEGRCLVYVIYDGCWSFAVSKADEDDPAPWAFSSRWSGYSQVIKADVPVGTKLEWRS